MNRHPHRNTCSTRLGSSVVLGVGLLLLGGCAGYQIGTESLYTAQVRTVNVPIFESNSFRRNLGERLTEAVMKEIEAKTPYKVVGNTTADSTLAGRIVGETKRLTIENKFDDPRQLEAKLQVEVNWVDHRGYPICSSQTIALPAELATVNGSASFMPEVGQSVATAHQQAIVRVAERIVGMMEAPW